MRPRRLPPKRLALFVDLKTRPLEVPHDSLGELLPGIVGHALAHILRSRSLETA